tara:strand:+ start:141 stop:809 length:669 start_codon:yes stop_codon:yes gene_type:complete
MTNWDILLLDKSGSMIDNKTDLINGFNELVNEQKKEESGNLFTVLTFNNEVELFKEGKFQNFQEIDNNSIITKGSTALYDAIGNAYDMILKNKMYTNITLTVITDGLENSSKFYTIDMLNDKKKQIDEKYTIKMVFIGADISCITEEHIALHASQSVDCSGNIHRALRIASRTMSSQREGIEYVPEESIQVNPVTPLIMKRSRSCNSAEVPKLKRCKTICKD